MGLGTCVLMIYAKQKNTEEEVGKRLSLCDLNVTYIRSDPLRLLRCLDFTFGLLLRVGATLCLDLVFSFRLVSRLDTSSRFSTLLNREVGYTQCTAAEAVCAKGIFK